MKSFMRPLSLFLQESTRVEPFNINLLALRANIRLGWLRVGQPKSLHFPNFPQVYTPSLDRKYNTMCKLGAGNWELGARSTVKAPLW